MAHLPSRSFDEKAFESGTVTPSDAMEKASDTESMKSPCRTPIDTSGESDNETITWHYLTFDTELPHPALARTFPTNINDQSSPPPCPDLKKYTSPFLWPKSRKTFITWLSCAATACTAYTAGSYTAGISQMSEEWHVSDVALEVGVTIFTCGFGIAPMFLAPFSEINGRQPVFIVTGILFVIFQLICAVTPTYAGMLVARFFAGCMSSTFSTMVGGVVSDLYHAEDRNTAMALFTAAAMFGTGFALPISTLLASHTTWRWIFYLQVILDGTLMIMIVLFFKETRGSVLLSRKAQTLNKWYDALESAGYYGVMMPSSDDSQKSIPQRIRWKVKADEERGSVLQMIRISLYRPFYMLISEPVVFFFSLWISFAWAVLYLTFSAIPLIFETTYNFTLEESGAVFAAISITGILFTFVAVYQEQVVVHFFPSQKQIFATPEGRLYFACIQSVLLPIGCVWFCVTGAYPSIPWIVPTLGVACATIGIFSIYLSVFNYLADSYHQYASSALAAQSCCRNILGGAFPLFTVAMFKTMTFQGAGGFLGGLGLLLTFVPWVLFLKGPAIRARSRLASEILGRKD